MSEDVRQKIIDIICAAWPTPDGYLLDSDIHERLRSQGFEVTEATLNTVLSELATSGRITLTLMPGAGDLDQALAESGAAIHDIEDDLCE